jgi:hypothetical protein
MAVPNKFAGAGDYLGTAMFDSEAIIWDEEGKEKEHRNLQ